MHDDGDDLSVKIKVIVIVMVIVFSFSTCIFFVHLFRIDEPEVDVFNVLEHFKMAPVLFLLLLNFLVQAEEKEEEDN